MVNTDNERVLKGRNGKYVTVSEEPGKTDGSRILKLCLRDSQTERYVKIHKRVSGIKNQVALSFRRSSGDYTLKVEGENLKLEKSGPTTEDHWFDKTNPYTGSGYCLQSVKSHRKYLSFENTENVFSLEQTMYVLRDE